MNRIFTLRWLLLMLSLATTLQVSAQVPNWLRDPQAPSAAGSVRSAAVAKPGHVEVELVSETGVLRAGQVNWLGLRMKHDEHWHSYWKNPGDAGVPTTIAWQLPAGYKAGGFEWPHPQRIQLGALASYGYEGEVLLPLQMFAPRDAKGGDTVHLQADARWLVCHDVCVPEQAHLELTLRVADKVLIATNAALFAQTRLKWPSAVPGTSAAARAVARDATSAAANAPMPVEVGLALPRSIAGKGQLFFERPDFVEPGAVPQVEVRDGRVVWKSLLTPNGRKLGAARLPAVWVPDVGGAASVQVNVEWPGCLC
jgi:thiol:disulfide interchange protein DsbD